MSSSKPALQEQLNLYRVHTAASAPPPSPQFRAFIYDLLIREACFSHPDGAELELLMFPINRGVLTYNRLARIR
jgi:hypothetical protein